MSDSRAGSYVAIHGDSSWEVDALPPEVLQQMVRDALDSLVDAGLMEEVKEHEEEDKRFLRDGLKGWLNGGGRES